MKKLILLFVFTFLSFQSFAYDFSGISVGANVGSSIEPQKQLGYREATFNDGGATLFPHRESWKTTRKSAFSFCPFINYGLEKNKLVVCGEFSCDVLDKNHKLSKQTSTNFNRSDKFLQLGASLNHDTSIKSTLSNIFNLDMKTGYKVTDDFCIFYRVGFSKNTLKCYVLSNATLKSALTTYDSKYVKTYSKNFWSLRQGLNFVYAINDRFGITGDCVFSDHGTHRINGSSQVIGDGIGNEFRMVHMNNLNLKDMQTSLGVYFKPTF